MHIQRIKTKKGDKVYESVLLRESYYEKGKRKKRTLARLTKVPDYLVNQLEMALKGEVGYRLEDLEFEDGYSIGQIGVLKEIMKEVGIEEMIYSKKVKERELVGMMVIMRVIHPSSKLENTRWIKREEKAWKEFYDIDYGKLRVDDLYKAMDWLEERKGRIEKKLYKGRGRCRLFLYDTTSSYLEGEKAEIGKFGYGKDKKKGVKQVVIGLVLDEEGYPVGVEVYPGNTSDQKTLKEKVREMKERYKLDKAIFVGDRGMITGMRMEEIEKEGYEYITSLTHRKIKSLIEEGGFIQLGLFDKELPLEVEKEGRRYILCKSRERCRKEKRELANLIKKTAWRYEKIRMEVEKGKLKDATKIAKKVGKWKGMYKVGKYFEEEIEEGKFNYRIKREDLKVSMKLMGCYVIVTNTSKEEIKTEEAVEYYRSLALVDRAFAIIKTILLNIRPIRHRKEKRIRAHAFICMLAYYIVWEMKKRLRKIFKENGKGRNYLYTFKGILDELKNIMVGEYSIKGIKIKKINNLSEREEMLLKELGIELKIKSRQ